MKTVPFLFALLLLGAGSFCQTVHKGSILGFHMYTANLKEGVAMNDFTAFLSTKLKPAIEKSFPGMKACLVKGLRGQDSSRIAVIYMFDNTADRNKYYNDDGSPTAAANASYAKLGDVLKELDKYGTFDDNMSRYTDWQVK